MTVEPPQPVVALFGAAGFVGRAMVSALLDAGYAVRALDLSEESWFSHTAHGRVRAERGLPHHPRAHDHLELLYGDISDQVVVEKVMRGCCACVHTTVFFPQQVGRPGQHAGVTFADAGSTADQTWLVNLKGLWNVLDAATRFGLRRIVHVGSAPTVHPGSSEHTPGTVKMTADVRRPDGSLYAIQKRMQEEMCRGFYEARGTRIVCLRPDAIVDLRTRSNRGGALGRYTVGWVCRHMLAECAIAAIRNDDCCDFGIFHTVAIPSPPIAGQPDPRAVCNVADTQAALHVDLSADVREFAADVAKL